MLLRCNHEFLLPRDERKLLRCEPLLASEVFNGRLYIYRKFRYRLVKRAAVERYHLEVEKDCCYVSRFNLLSDAISKHLLKGLRVLLTVFKW